MNISQSIERLQAYLSNPTEPERKAITALAAREEKRLIKDILTRLERLKAEGREQALFYDAGLEIERAYRTKEITEDEYKNSPLKKAFEEHAQAIPFRANELSMPCLMRATVTAPDYTSAVDKAIRRAEKLIKDIQKAADSNAETTAFIVKELISYICSSAYALYNPQEWREQFDSTKRIAEEIASLYKLIQEPATDKANNIYYQQIDELKVTERQLYEEQNSRTYKADRAQEITARILGRIFPEQKPAIRRAIATARQEPQGPAGFYLLAQNHTSNKLSKKLTERIANPAQFDIYGNGSIEERDFRLFVKGYSELVSGVNETAARLLDSLMITATRNGLQNTLVTLPIREYLDMRGLKDEREIRRQVRSDIDALERISFEYKGTGKNRGAWLKVSISGGTVGQIKNGDIVFRFNQDFFDSFKVGSKLMYMYFPHEALKGNIKENPWKYWLARKISEHKRMNIGKPNEDTISVQTLIDACPNYPTYEKIMKEDRAISRRIIEPFERDLNALSPSISWEYQGLNESPRNYQEFIAANIVVHWSEYPDTLKLEARKKKRAAKKQASKEKNCEKQGGETQQKGG
jgi:hypothetical protein